MALERTKRVLRVAGYFLLGICLLVTLPFLVLLIPSARQALVQRGLEYANTQTDYVLKLARADRLDPWGIDLHGLSVRDPEGDLALEVGTLSVRLAPQSLLGGRLVVRKVAVEHVRGHVRSSSKPAEPEKPEQPATEVFPIHVSELNVDDVVITAEGMGPVASVRVEHLVATGEFSDHPWVYLARADLAVDGREGALLRLTTRESRFSADHGGRVRLEGSLAGAPLTLQAAIGALEGETPWPKGRVDLKVSSLAPEAWVALGVPTAEVHQALSLTLGLSSSGSRAEVDLKVEGGATFAHVHAVASPERLEVVLDAKSPDLAATSGILPKLAVEGHLSAYYLYTDEPSELGVRWQRVVVDGNAVPDGRAVGMLALPEVKVLALSLDALGDSLAAHALWNTERSEGNVELSLNDLDLAALPLAMEEPIGGRADGRVAVSLATDGKVRGEGKLSFNDLRVGTIKVRSTRLEVGLSGSTERPEGGLELSASDLDLAGTLLSRLDVTGSGSKDAARARLAIHAREGWFVSDLGAQGLSSDVIELQGTGRGEAQGVPITFALQAQRQQGRERNAIAVQLSSGEDHLTAHASVNDAGRGHAQLDLLLPKLERLAALLGVKGLSGGMKGQVVADGELARPDVSVELLAEAVQVENAPLLFGTVRATSSLSRGELSAKANVWTLERDGGLTLDVRAKVPVKRDGRFEFAAATQESKVSAHVPLGLLTRFAGPEFTGLEGLIKLEAEARGPVQDPTADVVIDTSVSLPAHKELRPESLRVALHMTSAEASLRVRAFDLEGELLNMAGDVRWPNQDMRATLATIGAQSLPPFHLQARVSQRRLDTMQGVVAFLTGIYDIQVPIRVSADLDVEGDGSALRGSAHAKLLIHGDKLDRQCALGAQSNVELSVDLKNEDIEARMLAKTNQGGTVEATLNTKLLRGALATNGKVLEQMELRAQGRGIELPKLPGLCDLEAGLGAFNLRAKGFGDAPLEALLEIGLDGLKAPGGGAVGTQLTAALSQEGIRAEGKLRAEGRHAGALEARLPLVFTDGSVLPTLPFDKPVYAKFDFQSLPLGPFMSFGEGLGRPKGTATGSISMRGTLDAPEPAAVIELKDVSFSIASIAQPFRDIDGRLSLRGRTVRIKGLTARDRGGKVRIDGEASLAQDGSGAGEIRLISDEFPLRRQGEVVGELTTQIRVRAKMDTQQRVETEVRVDGGRLWLTGDRGRNVQSLAEHDEIRFVDAPADDPLLEAEKTTVAISLASLKANTEKSLWVMHKDFTVQVGLDITLRKEEEFTMKGSCDIQRGNLDLLGKSFRIEKGAITFTGDFPPDPEIELRAVYETPTGDDLNVSVTGRGSAPVLTFSGAASTAGEAMAVLSGSGRSGAESEAQADAANFAAGLTAGLLSVTIREEFGEWVPIISIENDASGAPARGRAGFDASKLIPPFLEGIARGAYVEGIVGSTDQTGGSVGLGARLEISFPHDFVTSTGYGPGPTWGADLMWAP